MTTFENIIDDFGDVANVYFYIAIRVAGINRVRCDPTFEDIVDEEDGIADIYPVVAIGITVDVVVSFGYGVCVI